MIRAGQPDKFATFNPVLMKMANLDKIEQVTEQPENVLSFVIKGDEFFLPFEGQIDVEKERGELEKEIEYTKGFLSSVSKKLSNERFVNNAPEQVVANEKKKMADAEAKLKALQEQLTAL